MKLILLGSGNAATQLGMAFYEAGFKILQIYSPNPEHASLLAEKLESAPATSPAELNINQADAVISALKDSVAENVWRQLDFGNCPVFHTAGSMPMNTLQPFAKHYGVLYPLQTLTRNRKLDFKKVPLFLEAESAETMQLLHKMADTISNSVREITSEQRKELHLAAVFANNFSNHMFNLATQLLQKNNLEFELLLPLIDETAAKVHDLPPEQAQTGPAIRYDENIIGKHLQLLENQPEIAEIYRLISRSIHNSSRQTDKSQKG